MPTFIRRLGRASPKLDTARLRRLANRMLGALGSDERELSILLVDDRRMQALNREHRKKDRPTDVLSFPLIDADAPASPLLGDVVISLETALRQARSRKRALLPEVRFLLAHGLLHLIGHDHGTKSQKRRMDRETRRLVRAASDDEHQQEPGRARPQAARKSTPTSRTKRAVRGR